MTDETLMAQMHGRLPDGTWLRGVEVFRRMYAAVGFGPLVFLSRLPLISQVAPDFFRVVGWYDNENAYALRCVDLLEYMAKMDRA